jgi:hypothetical protein
MRGLKKAASTRRISLGHALVQNLRRGHYELGLEVPPNRRLAAAFTELALVMTDQPNRGLRPSSHRTTRQSPVRLPPAYDAAVRRCIHLAYIDPKAARERGEPMLSHRL